MSVNRAKWVLALVWMLGAGLVFLVLVGQSLTGVYEPRTTEAWGWFLPTVMPTLSLIIAVLVADYRPGAPSPEISPPAGPLFWIALALSTGYLLLVAATVFLQPIVQQTDPILLMQRSNLWIGPAQGLTVGALGAYFRRGG